MHARDHSVFLGHAGDGHPLNDGGSLHSRALDERHRDVDGVGAAVFLHVKAGEHVVDARQREEVGHLARRDLVYVDAAVPVEGRDAAVLLESIGVGRDLDEPHRVEARRQAGFSFEARVEIARVLAHLGRSLGR